jgi:hypothetical protein
METVWCIFSGPTILGLLIITLSLISDTLGTRDVTLHDSFLVWLGTIIVGASIPWMIFSRVEGVWLFFGPSALGLAILILSLVWINRSVDPPFGLQIGVGCVILSVVWMILFIGLAIWLLSYPG